jgi:hypothetical protein
MISFALRETLHKMPCMLVADSGVIHAEGAVWRAPWNEAKRDNSPHAAKRKSRQINGAALYDARRMPTQMRLDYTLFQLRHTSLV